MKNIFLMHSILILSVLYGCKGTEKSTSSVTKPTICVLGGTPSTDAVVDYVPQDIKEKYNIISFNRPGFGGTLNGTMSKEKLFDLARKAGMKKNDFGVIGVSGGGPLALLLAEEFKISHCGIISGMVSREAYEPYSDSTFTKPLMNGVLLGYDSFKTQINSFPNVEAILVDARSPKEMAIRASYDELSFLLSKSLYNKHLYESVNVTWWHGEKDKKCRIRKCPIVPRQF